MLFFNILAFIGLIAVNLEPELKLIIFVLLYLIDMFWLRKSLKDV
jgi:hypothetical protein